MGTERSLKNITDDELKEEIKRREKEKKCPTPRSISDWTIVEKIVKEYVQSVNSDDYCDDNNYDHYIAEAAIEAVYGEKFWEWYNEKM